ncbi:signal recognition particle, SRP19 subunit [Polychytrium aggregatum]|uniref:signal recognition particle, SRP19 subunit n=1 Tax=Polychytrium aggregatum TaxID=110093 RepID=UPI0022FE4A7E|nr:signal recognition particle, SRP19 subunit [Polychytrium aggregatum]KAI9199466.1 signal recognition particle, SRP19 subunit [Polychytrium aggregatum]
MADRSTAYIEDDDEDIDEMDFDLPTDLVSNLTIQDVDGPLLQLADGSDEPETSLVPSASVSARRAQILQQQQQQQQQLQQPSAEEIKNWVSIYPVNIDADKSMAGGRRVPKAVAVAEPSIVYMFAAAQALNLPCMVENDKRHPRDPFAFGRLRVCLKDPQGHPVRAAIPNKIKLLSEIAQGYAAAQARVLAVDARMSDVASASRSQVSKSFLEAVVPQASSSSSSATAATPAGAAASPSGAKKQKIKRKVIRG